MTTDQEAYLDCRTYISTRLQAFVNTTCYGYVDDERIPDECKRLLQEWGTRCAFAELVCQSASDAVYKEVCGIVAGPPPKILLTKYDFGPYGLR
jgi:hypothetical protein